MVQAASTKKRKIAVLFGGRSAEHEISVITALQAIEALDPEKYEAIPVYIDAHGKWYSGRALLNKQFYREMPGSLKEVEEVALLPKPGIGGLVVLEAESGFKVFSSRKTRTIPVDVFLPIFHGQFGEDGCIQGLFELADVVYTGSGVLASAVAMSKYHCKSLLHAHGIPVLPAVVVAKLDMQKNVKETRRRILETRGLEEFPLFVKPVNLGSSVGVGRATNEAELDAALASAFQFDFEAIVEPCVSNLMEINVSVIETKSGARASVVEIPVSSTGVLTYEDKYLRNAGGKKGAKTAGPQRIEGMAGLTRVIDPEDLPGERKSTVTKHALDAYNILGCGGVVRFDFIVDLDTDSLYFNELNPLPGSLSFYLWEKTKPALLFPDILDEMIAAGINRKEARAGLQRDIGFKALLR